ncbi:MAG: SdrD B-like domain-containing protein, partial [Planctomycetota bacterium]
GDTDTATITVDVVDLYIIGDFVWFDSNSNGIQDGLDTGLADVPVKLLDQTDSSQLAETTSDEHGFYSFGELPAGEYIVEFTTPFGYELTANNQGANDDADSDADPTTGQVALSVGDHIDNFSIDAGFVAIAESTISGVVWQDDIRADGIRDFGFELLVEGVNVKLLDANDVTIRDTTTDEFGYYEFTALTAGDYRLEFELPGDAYSFVQANQGDDATDSDADPATGQTALINLGVSQQVTDVFAGMELDDSRASISGRVWNDLNGDGIQDSGEPGWEGVVLRISGPGVVEYVNTDTQGFYGFGGLAAGSYTVSLVRNDGTAAGVPEGFELSPANMGDDQFDSDILASGTIIHVAAEEAIQSVDAGLSNPNNGSIGDRVWYDRNGDGIQNNGEPGLEGARATLHEIVSGRYHYRGSRKTDRDGRFAFPGLAAGDYRLSVSHLGYAITLRDQGADDGLDSDAEGQNALIYTSLNEDEQRSDLDVGYVLDGSSRIIVTVDSQYCYESALGERCKSSFQAGLPVSLLDAEGRTLVTKETSVSFGWWTPRREHRVLSFQGLPVGTYQIVGPWGSRQVITTEAGQREFLSVRGERSEAI